MGRRTDICNIALVGHNDSGKTTLGEAFLFLAKATPQRGSVADGTSILDSDPEERRRKTSMELGMAHFSWGGRTFNLLDAPGMYDFCGEAHAALMAAENAVLCVHAVSGIMVNTRKMWKAAGDLERVRTIVVTKADMENADLPGLIRSIRATFGEECVLVNVPVGSGPAIEGVAGSLAGDVPEAWKEEAQRTREKIVEMDDALMEKYLGGEEVAPTDLERILADAVASRRLVPVLFTAALKDVGVREALDFFARLLPGPEVQDGDGLVAQVFKSVHDPFVGRIAYGKVYAGTITADRPIFNNRTETQARIGSLFKPFGKDQKAVSKVDAGDIFAVTKVDDLLTGDTITHPGAAARLPVPKFPVPMVSLSVEPKSREHEQRLSTALARLADGEKTFTVTRDAQTGEMVVTGMSQFHIEVMLERMKRRYQVEVTTKTPKIPFRETITRPAEGHYRHKKQTGGRGQYGEVFLKIEPLERGAGFEFVDEIKGGKIPGQYLPAVEKGIREAAEKGVLAGYPVVDFRVRVYDGSYHEVDSSPESFKIAGSRAFKNAFAAAGPVLIEPIVNLEVFVPTQFMGDITGHLNQRRGRIMGIEAQGSLQVIRAQIPLMEVTNYAAELRAMTGGEGFYSIEFAGYDILPHRLAEGVIAQAKREEEQED